MAQTIPISFTNILSGEKAVDASFQLPQTNYDEKLNDRVVNNVLSERISNPKEASFNALMQMLPGYLSANTNATLESTRSSLAPMFNTMMKARMEADEQGANIQNEITKRQQVAQLAGEYAKSRNPQNMGALATMIQNVGGQAPDPRYMAYSFIDPATGLNSALSAAERQAGMEMQKYSTDAQTALGYAQIAAQKEIAAQRGGGAGGAGNVLSIDAIRSGVEKWNKGLNDILNAYGETNMDDPAKEQGVLNNIDAFVESVGRTYLAGNPEMTRAVPIVMNGQALQVPKYMNDIAAAKNSVRPGLGDRWLTGVINKMQAQGGQQE